MPQVHSNWASDEHKNILICISLSARLWKDNVQTAVAVQSGWKQQERLKRMLLKIVSALKDEKFAIKGPTMQTHRSANIFVPTDHQQGHQCYCAYYDATRWNLFCEDLVRGIFCWNETSGGWQCALLFFVLVLVLAAAAVGSIPPGGPLLHSPSLSPSFPISLQLLGRNKA